MKTYHFTITDSKGNQVATCEIAHDGTHAGARQRAKAQAKAWKALSGYKGTITCRTVYGSNPEAEQSAAITALDKLADAYEEIGEIAPTPQYPQCPECLNLASQQELNMFGGLCEECANG